MMATLEMISNLTYDDSCNDGKDFDTGGNGGNDDNGGNGGNFGSGGNGDKERKAAMAVGTPSNLNFCQMKLLSERFHSTVISVFKQPHRSPSRPPPTPPSPYRSSSFIYKM